MTLEEMSYLEAFCESWMKKLIKKVFLDRTFGLWMSIEKTLIDVELISFVFKYLLAIMDFF